MLRTRNRNPRRRRTRWPHCLQQADWLASGSLSAPTHVPQDAAGAITDDTRIRASVPAIAACLQAGAAVMVTSHLGRPQEGAPDPRHSLAPVGRRLSELLGRQVPLLSGWTEGGFQVRPGRWCCWKTAA